MHVISRCVSTLRTCNASTADGLDSPLCMSGSTLTCHRLRANLASHSVMGATSFTGKIPMALELMITAGRFFLISAPTVGSKLTIHIWPRAGLHSFEGDKITPLNLRTGGRAIGIGIPNPFGLFR